MSNPAKSFYNWYSRAIRHPKYRWLIVLGSLAYLLSPVDLLPDVLFPLGFIDDGLLATLLVAELSQLLLGTLQQKGRRTQPDHQDTEEPVIDVTPH